MAISDWFKKGNDSVRAYSDELDRKSEESKNRKFVMSVIVGDGESKVLRFLTNEPITFREHYLGNAQGRKYYTCLKGSVDEAGELVDCPFCSAGNKPSFRGAFMVIDRSVDEWEDSQNVKHSEKNVVKIFKQGIKVLKVLDKLSAKKNLLEWEVEISRTGSSTDTQYNFIPEEKTLPMAIKDDAETVKVFLDKFEAKSFDDILMKELRPISVGDAIIVLSGGKPQGSTVSFA